MGAPENEREAIRLFQAAAAKVVSELDEGDVRRKYGGYSQRIAAKEKLVARRQTFRASFERVDGTLLKPEREMLVLLGEISKLNRDGNCWAVQTTGTIGNELVGYLDAADGKLVFLWIVPEG